jgi:hypothetical protein
MPKRRSRLAQPPPLNKIGLRSEFDSRLQIHRPRRGHGNGAECFRNATDGGGGYPRVRGAVEGNTRQGKAGAQRCAQHLYNSTNETCNLNLATKLNV